MPGAAIPLQLQIFSAFAGQEESIHSINLPNIFSSGGCQNTWLDKYGRAKKIDGYSKQNTSAYTTNTGGETTIGRGIFPYRNTSSGAIQRQTLIVYEGLTHVDIVVSNDAGVTYTFLVDQGSSAIGQIPIFAQFGQLTYIVNGKTTPQKYNGSTIANAGLTQSPTPTATASATVGVLTGNYTYKLVSINSDGTRAAGSAASTSLNVQGKQVSLSWTADADATKKGYEIYRSTGSGTLLFLVTYVDGHGTTSYTDNTDDFTVLQNPALPIYGDPPPTVYFAVPHKQRIWWMRTDANPTRAFYSDAGQAESVYQVANYIDFSDGDISGDQITGGVGNFTGLLVVFTEKAVWRVSGTGQVVNNVVDWQRSRSNAQTGCVSQRSAWRVPANAKYSDEQGNITSTSGVMLAYWTPLGDIRLFDGDNDRVISLPVKTTISTFNYSARNKIFCYHDTVRAEITWYYPDGTSSECNKAVTWNYRWGSWVVRTLGFGHGVEADTSGAASTILALGNGSTVAGGGPSANGTAYLTWNGNSFDGSAIKAQWMTKTLYGANLRFGDGAQPYGQAMISHTKRWRWLDFLFSTQQTISILVEWMPGNTPDNVAATGSTTVTPNAATLQTSLGSNIDTANASDILVAAQTTTQRVILKSTVGRYLYDTSARYRISESSTNGSWALEGMNMAFQILPGTQRRMQEVPQV